MRSHLATPPSSEAIASRTEESASAAFHNAMRSFDWSRTSLGSLEAWPASQKKLVDTLLDSGFAQALVAAEHDRLLHELELERARHEQRTAELRASERRLRDVLEAVREIAEDARRDAELANRAKTAFLTTMSHELRTPLNAVAGYADLLLLGVRGPLAEGQREDLERIKRSGQYLLSLINDVLNFAKLGTGQVEYRIETMRLAPLLESIEELIQPQITAKGLRYRRASYDPALAVHADAEKLRQILLNLLANAVKFTDAGGEVTLDVRSDGCTIAIEVGDTGRGIGADQLETIFDPFVQVDRHLTPMSQQGVGLGLAISRDLAIGMDGGLTVQSEVGRGSQFTLTLPAGES